jgi:hypothetical protein
VDICQKNELPIRGTKAELIERILSSSLQPPSSSSSRVKSSSKSKPAPYHDLIQKKSIPDNEKWLLVVLADFLSSASPASSRDVGRYLVKVKYDDSSSASDVMKKTYGSLSQIMNTHGDLFKSNTDEKKVYTVSLIK